MTLDEQKIKGGSALTNQRSSGEAMKARVVELCECEHPFGAHGTVFGYCLLCKCEKFVPIKSKRRKKK